MQQRRVRLGDVLDDYCPRERRITNHAVVAMIDDEVKQTRCSTCDAEHEYKEARVPAARRKKGGALSVDAPETLVRRHPPAASSEPPFEENADLRESEPSPEPPSSPDPQPMAAAPSDDEQREDDADDGAVDHWGHRPLIRATLPRQEGQVPERKAPDFTFRPSSGRFDNRNGHRPRGARPGRPGQGPVRQGQGQGSTRQGSGQSGQGQRHGSPQGQRQGGQFRPNSPQGNRPGSNPRGGQPRGPGGPGRKRGR